MEFEQLQKKVQWLDDERRKDKNIISNLQEQIERSEGKLTASLQANDDLLADITHLKTIISRMDNYEDSLVNHRSEIQKQLNTLEKQTGQRDNEMMSVLRAEIHAYDGYLEDIRSELAVTRELKKEMAARVTEEDRLARQVDELRIDLEETRRNEEDQSRLYRVIEDGRRQDSKRISDVQGEIGALRKRYEENRGKLEINEISTKKLENRVNELITTEQDRISRQDAIQEKQALLDVERESIWKDWETRFSTIEKQAVDVEDQIQSLDSTYMAVKRTQDAVDDLIGRVERRINEVAEIQRLAEERFRQEWTTFKADDQKRWANMTLSEDEQRSEINRRLERAIDRITYIEDILQQLQDSLIHINELNSKSISSLLSVVHEWVSAYERSGLSR
jgi:chromosome segregation ATPase